MKPNLLRTIRSRTAAWVGPRPKPSVRPAGPTPDTPTIAERAPGPGAPLIGLMFNAPPHRHDGQAAALDAQIREIAARIEKLQPGYQSIYGFGDEFKAKRQPHLERNVDIVAKHLKDVVPKHQVRILDVGCNSGYVSLRLAETFPNVVGLEISPDHLQLCRLLAARSGSGARFFGDDLLAMMAGGRDDLENVDVVLLYNVVHQFIFLHGLEHTKALLARLARRVDTVVVELARRADYVKHGKDQLLPEDPAEALADCEDCDITKLHDRPRPVYLVRRRKVRLGTLELRPESVDYSLNADARVSRKYYAGGDRFLKLYRFGDAGDSAMFEREVGALLALRGTRVAPRVLDWSSTPHYGAILMTRIKGPRVRQLLQSPELRPETIADRLRLTQRYLEIAQAVHAAIGFQNDLQWHNLLVRPNGHLVLVDYEQASREARIDPFGVMLWCLFELWGGRSKERPAAIRSLRVPEAAPEHPPADVPPKVYPDFAGVKLDPTVAAMVAKAALGGDWAAFLAEWLPRVRGAATRGPHAAGPAPKVSGEAR